MVTGKTIYRGWCRKWYRVWKWILIQDGSLKQISSLIATPLTILIQDGSLKQISSLTPNHIYCNTIDQEQDDSGDEFFDFDMESGERQDRTFIIQFLLVQSL